MVRPQVDLTIGKLDNHLDKNLKKKGTNRTLDSHFLLRQGEPGTSQYNAISAEDYNESSTDIGRISLKCNTRM